MLGITKNVEATTDVWGNVQFFLDDNMIDEKKIWASGSNTQKSQLSFLDSLSFTFETLNPNFMQPIAPIDQELEDELELLKGFLRIINNASESQRIQMANKLNVPTVDRGVIKAELESRILFLISIRPTVDAIVPSSVARVIPPPLSLQEKRNHTFTLSDEGRDWVNDSTHYYRIIITELHAFVNSENDNKEFNWQGQHIAYELKVTVNPNKVVIVKDSNGVSKAIEVLKSDGTLQLCGKSINTFKSSTRS